MEEIYIISITLRGAKHQRLETIWRQIQMCLAAREMLFYFYILVSQDTLKS